MYQVFNMTEKRDKGRPKNPIETEQKILRVPVDILKKAEDKARKNGLNFQAYTIQLIAKDVND